MNTDRRSFLKGLLTVAAVAVLPKPALAGYPILHGDGIHDDTAALQAMIDGKKVIIDGQVLDPTISDARCRMAKFFITDEIRVRRGGIKAVFEECQFLYDFSQHDPADNPNRCALYLEHESKFELINVGVWCINPAAPGTAMASVAPWTILGSGSA